MRGRVVVRWVMCLVAGWLVGCTTVSPPAPGPGLTATPVTRSEQVEQAERRAVAFLVGRQSEDGAWRSQVYRDMGSGLELTPYVGKSLAYSDPKLGGLAAAEKGRRFLAQAATEELIYPVYTSAGALLLAHGGSPPERRKWRPKLLQFQLTRAGGYPPDDVDLGGWGYAMRPPRYAAHDPLAHSNLSSTTFAVGALRLSGSAADSPEVQAALAFVKRCQNTDGGFCVAPGEPVLNKAGTGPDGHGYNSYGTATSDGLRSLLRGGLGPTSAEVTRARAWMVEHFQTDYQPGDFPESRFADRDSLRFYYLWSTAHALAALERSGAPLTTAEKALCERLVDALLEAQQPDGSWQNPMGASREDDPLVATSLALGGLTLAARLSSP